MLQFLNQTIEQLQQLNQNEKPRLDEATNEFGSHKKSLSIQVAERLTELN